MRIYCRHCAEAIPATDVNLDRMVAKCGACDAVFDFSNQLSATETAQPEVAATLARQRPRAVLPKGWTLEKTDGSAVKTDFGYRANATPAAPAFRLSWRWFKPAQHIFMLFFAVIWNGILGMFYQGIMGTNDTPVLALLFPILHVAVGGYVAYAAITGFVNRTTITAKDGILRIKHHPLPWPGSRSFASADLKQVYCKKKTRRNKGNEYISYTVQAQLADEEIVLLKDLDDYGPALFVEQLIESAVGLEDVAVAGEATG